MLPINTDIKIDVANAHVQVKDRADASDTYRDLAGLP